MNTLEKIQTIKNLGEYLVQFNFPLGTPDLAGMINILKITELTIDGYTFNCHYNKADYGDHFYVSCQLFGKNTPFIPFHLVVKTARLVLGDEHLTLLEVLENGRKTYCWGLMTDRDGKALIPNLKSSGEKCYHEGFEYTYLPPGSLKFR